MFGGYGIDLGTANTVVAHRKRGIVLDEPSVMTVRTDQRGRRVTPVLVGDASHALVGRCPAGLNTVRPLRDGVIVDLEAARGYIVGVLSRVTSNRWQRLRPRAVIGVPAGATALERRALMEAAEEAGIGRARLLPEPIAGAIGCGIDPLQPRAHMVIDVGGGTSEVTAFCYGGVLAHRSCRVAGDELTLALFQYLRHEHQLIVGETTAEAVEVPRRGRDRDLVGRPGHGRRDRSSAPGHPRHRGGHGGDPADGRHDPGHPRQLPGGPAPAGGRRHPRGRRGHLRRRFVAARLRQAARGQLRVPGAPGRSGR